MGLMPVAKRKQAARKPRVGRKPGPRPKKRAAKPATDLRKENATLRRELVEALEQQTATSEALKVISSSPGALKAVFDTILEKAVRICEASFGTMFLMDGRKPRWAAGFRTPLKLVQYVKSDSFQPTPGSHLDRVIRTSQVSRSADDVAELVLGASARLGGARSTVCVPMIRDDALVGAITMYRTEVRPFTDRQINLVKSFAAQAVIAVENARLFDEVQRRTRDLEESLQRQTATADALNMISRSAFHLQPVLDTLVRSAARLCNAEMAFIYRREVENYRLAANVGFPTDYETFIRSLAITPGRETVTARAALDRCIVHVDDIVADPEYRSRETIELGKARTLLGVPLMREGEPIGVITLARQRVEPFSERQIELVRTFADQAVIAIENARLFEQVQQRTRELSQSLDDLRAAQDRLVQTEKLASLGQLTAGIAHEIKNPLNFVNNFAALSAELTEELNETLAPAPLDQKMRSDFDELTGMLKSNLEKVVQHGKRADSIVKNMLQHSREGSGERRSADINALVGESLNLAYHGARAEKPGFAITLKHDLDPDAGALELYPQEITRALLNLISNGFYAAMGRKAETDDVAFDVVDGARS